MKKRKLKKKDLPSGENIPRFVVSITDTQTIHNDQYYSINVGADSLDDFTRLIPKKKRTNEARTELQNMFYHMRTTIEELDKEITDDGRDE